MGHLAFKCKISALVLRVEQVHSTEMFEHQELRDSLMVKI